MQSLKDELRTFITDSIMYGHNTGFLADDSSFLDSGIIDSTGVLELINFMESRFGFTVEDRELIPANLDSINGLIHFIESKTSAAKAQASGA